MNSDNMTPTSYERHQQAPIAHRGGVDLENQTSVRPRRARPTNPTTPTNPITLQHKAYVLSYDAQRWHHTDTTDKITHFNGKSVYIGPVGANGKPRDRQSSGFLGLYISENTAEMMGDSWLYDQLRAVDSDFRRPLPKQDMSRCEKVTWKMSGWVRSADGSWASSISDTFRDVELVVLVTEVDELEAGVGQKGNTAGQDDEGGGAENVDLTGDGEQVREGNAGKRKRSETGSEERESGGTETGDQTGTGGYVNERNAKKGKTKEVTEDELEGVSLLLAIKGGRL